jgi:hypothetical protein
MVLSIIILEDKHKIVFHLSIFYEYQQFFQHRICCSIQPPDHSDPWPTLARSTSLYTPVLRRAVLCDWVWWADQYIQDKRQVFQVWHNLCSELTSMWTFKMYSRNTKATNEPTASTNNKSDRPQVNIWDNWKTLKYLNINDSIHLKDLEISIKRESKAWMPIQFCFFFVNCGLFSFLNIKKVKI